MPFDSVFRLAIATVMLAVCNQHCIAQAEEDERRPRLTRFRYDENWSYVDRLRDSDLIWPEGLKNRSLFGEVTDPRLSVGAEVRTRYEWIDNPDGSSVDEDDDGYLWNRVLPYLDWQDSDRYYRIFLQFDFAYVSDRENGLEPFDEDRADFLQLFTDIDLLDEGHWKLRLGRRVLGIGSERLVSNRYGINVIRSFDCVELTGQVGESNMRALYGRPVDIGVGAFDNEPSDEQQLWGTYFSRPGVNGSEGGFDYYYLGFADDVARFDQGVGREVRHSLGVRSFGRQKDWFWNTEAIIQFGRFADDDILAWTGSIEVGRQLVQLPTKPRFDLKFDVISGDADPNDNTLGTFNPLFPSLKYFGESGVFAPYNLIDLHPELRIPISKRTTLATSVDFLWRYSKNDGVYGPGGRLIRSGIGSDARHVGTQYEVLLETEWRYGLTTMCSYNALPAGRFIEETGPSETIHFVAAELMWKF